MELPRALAADLRDLAYDLNAGGWDRTSFALFEHNLRRSVPTALGATLTITEDSSNVPVSVHLVSRAVDPIEIASALEVRLTDLLPAAVATVIFYAAQHAALDELGHQLAEVLDVQLHDLNLQPALPEHPLQPQVVGLIDLSTVNRALGVLMNRGHSITGAQDELRDRARNAKIDLVTAAQALLNSLWY